MYDIKISSQFKKDIKLAKKQGRNIDELFKVIELLANGELLPPKYKDHELSGNYSSYRECHINPDWLLLYRIYEDILVLYLARIGSHSDLFS